MIYDQPEVEVGPVGSLIASLKRAVSTVLGIAQTRLELISVELQEEVGRAARLLVWAFIALFAAGIGLFLGALVLIFAFWETHRVLVSVLMVGFFFTMALAAALVLRSKLRHGPTPFDATIAEFKRDREQLEQ